MGGPSGPLFLLYHAVLCRWAWAVSHVNTDKSGGRSARKLCTESMKKTSLPESFSVRFGVEMIFKGGISAIVGRWHSLCIYVG